MILCFLMSIANWCLASGGGVIGRKRMMDSCHLRLVYLVGGYGDRVYFLSGLSVRSPVSLVDMSELCYWPPQLPDSILCEYLFVRLPALYLLFKLIYERPCKPNFSKVEPMFPDINTQSPPLPSSNSSTSLSLRHGPLPHLQLLHILRPHPLIQ